MSASFPRPGVSCSLPTTEKYRLEIVEANGLNSLLRLLQSQDPDAIFAAVSCVRNLATQPAHASPIIKAGFLQPLVALLAFKDDERTQGDAAAALRGLAAGTRKNRRAIFNAGAVQFIKELVFEVPLSIQIQMTGCIRNLSCSGMHSPFNCLL